MVILIFFILFFQSSLNLIYFLDISCQNSLLIIKLIQFCETANCIDFFRIIAFFFKLSILNSFSRSLSFKKGGFLTSPEIIPPFPVIVLCEIISENKNGFVFYLKKLKTQNMPDSLLTYLTNFIYGQRLFPLFIRLQRK